jgi:hypothetical protein
MLRWFAGLSITALTVWLFVTRLAWYDTWRAVASADPLWIIVALLAITATLFSRAWRWQSLLASSRVNLVGRITAILMGQIVNQFIPLIRSGELVRAYWLKRYQDGIVIEALGSIALEKSWDLLAISVCSLALIFSIPLPAWFRQSAWGSLLTISLIVILLGLGLRWQTGLIDLVEKTLGGLDQGWRQAWMPRIRRLVSALNVARHPRASLGAGLGTALTWALGMLANWSVLVAFGESSVWAAILLMIALMLGSAVVPTPGRLGVFEGISVVVLKLFDVPADRALAVGLVLHVVALGPPVVIGAALALWDTVKQTRHGQNSVTTIERNKPEA